MIISAWWLRTSSKCFYNWYEVKETTGKRVRIGTKKQQQNWYEVKETTGKRVRIRPKYSDTVAFS